jgi:hypothetical protein
VSRGILKGKGGSEKGKVKRDYTGPLKESEGKLKGKVEGTRHICPVSGLHKTCRNARYFGKKSKNL